MVSSLAGNLPTDSFPRAANIHARLADPIGLGDSALSYTVNWNLRASACACMCPRARART
eukprot:1046950-Alexandrium_andersonii.AAC.1